VDDAFHAFVWSIIAQQPVVRVGVVPPGAATEVFVAPRTSAKKKVKATGEAHVEEEPSVLDIIPDAASLPLEHLKREYGDSLRIAVDPETLFSVITGSHIKVRVVCFRIETLAYMCFLLVHQVEPYGLHCIAVGDSWSGKRYQRC
jgi:hypothetical protein